MELGEKAIGIILGVVCAALFGVCGFYFVTVDRKAPTINFQGDTPVYAVGDDESVLLSNVVAFDEKEGNLTAQVQIDSIDEMEDGAKVRVTYVVKDSKNNIATATQTIVCETDEQKAQREAEAAAQAEAEAVAQAEAEAAAQEEAAAATQEEEEAQGTEPGQTPTPAVNENPEAPVITLTASAATIGVSDNFRYNDYITSIEDNTDNSSTLWQNIHIQGDYTTKAAGTYELTFSVTDSQGNVSTPQTFTLTRQ